MPDLREKQFAIAVQAVDQLVREGNKPPNAAPKTQPNVANMRCTSLQTRWATSQQNTEAAKDRFHLHSDPGWSTCFAKLGALFVLCQPTFQTAFGLLFLEEIVIVPQHP